MRILTNVVIFVLIMSVSAVIALLSLDPLTLTHMGIFGSCFEGGCGYAAIFVGFPLITLVLTTAGCVIWFVLRRRG